MVDLRNVGLHEKAESGDVLMVRVHEWARKITIGRGGCRVVCTILCSVPRNS
jgi:hypothetical protein